METVITPEALEQSKFRKIALKDLYNPEETSDEAFVFVFPSPDPVDQVNGDGQLIEIDDCEKDFSFIYTSHRRIHSTPETIIYVR